MIINCCKWRRYQPTANARCCRLLATAIHIGKQPEAPWTQRNHPRRRSMYRRVNALQCPGFIGRPREGVQ
jgi:hypothetical protein